MCLQYKYPDKIRKKIVDKLENSIILYKIAIVTNNNKYATLLIEEQEEYKVGLNVARKKKIGVTDNIQMYHKNREFEYYDTGFHFFEKKRDARQKMNDRYYEKNKRLEVIECHVQKKWITEIGVEDFKRVFVTEKAYFPKYKTK